MPSSHVDVTTPDGIADAYLSQGEGGGPGVLLMMDAFGLRPRIEEMADRIAARGYVVLAPNTLYRAGRAPVLEMPDLSDPDNRTEFFGKLMPLMAEVTPKRAAADGAAYLDFLAGLTTGPVAITGYCMGGRLGWRIAAAHADRVAALGAFHTGGLVTDAPDSPHLSADQLEAELCFGHADEDANMTPDQQRTLAHALEAAGVDFTAAMYPGAQHGYTMSDTAAYDEAATERHFADLFALLDRAL